MICSFVTEIVPTKPLTRKFLPNWHQILIDLCKSSTFLVKKSQIPSKSLFASELGWVKIRTPIQDNYFLVDFLCGIRNNIESSHIEPYFAADTLYKIQLWTNQKALYHELASHWCKVGFYKGCPQQNKALYENFQHYS